MTLVLHLPSSFHYLTCRTKFKFRKLQMYALESKSKLRHFLIVCRFGSYDNSRTSITVNQIVNTFANPDHDRIEFASE